MITYRWGKETDYQKIIELANHAFDEKNFKNDFESDTGLSSYFPACLPKLYQNIETAPMHYLAIKDDVFVGNVALFNLPTSVAGNMLNVGGIGTVCTHPSYRREGFMLQLMKDVIEKAKEEGRDYLVLGGQRQRYENWGFEYVGLNPEFSYEPGNFRRLFSEDANFHYEFRELLESDEDFILRERVMRMSDGIYQKRSEELEYKALFSMFHKPYVILKNNKFVGTFLLSKEESDIAFIRDLRLLDELPVIEILNDLMKYLLTLNKKSMKVSDIAPEHVDLFTRLYKTCDYYQMSWSEMIKILNYENTIKAYLEYKASYTLLPDGEASFSFENGEQIKIKVKDNKVSVYPLMFEDADVKLKELDALNLLFSPGVSITTFESVLKPEVRAWFPLPFFMAMSDEV